MKQTWGRFFTAANRMAVWSAARVLGWGKRVIRHLSALYLSFICTFDGNQRE